jgi:hypothetical protein
MSNVSKHTEGPWVARGNHVFSGDTKIVVAVKGGVVVRGNAGQNARLIAAPPDLLAACEALLAADLYADNEGIWRFADSDTTDGAAAVALARAAIAKAKGGE